MSSTGRKWLIGCGSGCGGAILIVVVVSLISGLMMMKPMNRAVDIQNKLTAELGDRDTYTPPAEAPSPERIEAFLAVRRAVMPVCERFTEMADKFDSIEELGRKSDKPGGGEMFRAVTQMSGSLLGLVGNIGELTVARNEALLAQHMSLGEYAWIYALVYNSWLGHTPSSALDGREKDEAPKRQRAALVGMMRRHATALAAAGRLDDAAVWKSEADRVDTTAVAAAFAGGELPADWLAAFTERGDELRGLYCGPMAEFDLGEVRKQGLSVRSE